VDEVKGKGKDHEVRKRVQEEFWTTPFGLTFNKKEEVLTALNERTALLRVVRDAQQTILGALHCSVGIRSPIEDSRQPPES